MNKRKYLPIMVVSMTLVVCAVSCNSGGARQPRPTSTRVSVPTSEPTNTPLPVEPTNTPILVEPTSTPAQAITPQLEDQIFNLFEEVYFVPPAGGGDCVWRIDPVEPPAVWLTHRSFMLHDDANVICLLGFPLDEPITVGFYNLNGDLVYTGDFVADEESVYPYYEEVIYYEYPVGSVMVDDEGFLNIGIDIAWSAVFPVGGTLRAASASTYAESTFDARSWVVGETRISVLPAGWESNVYFFGQDGCFPFSAGDVAEIVGSGFQPNSSFSLGIYHGEYMNQQGVPMRLVFSDIVSSDSQGTLFYEIQIEPTDPAGYYNVFVMTADPNQVCDIGDWVYSYEPCPVGALACYHVP